MMVELGWWRLAAAFGLHGLLFSLHASLFGATVLDAPWWWLTGSSPICESE